MGEKGPQDEEVKVYSDRVDSQDGDAPKERDPILDEFSYEEIQAIKHRIDRRLVVVVGAMYCVSLMDRTNLGATSIAG